MKKHLWLRIAMGVLCVATVLLVPFNILIHSFPAWVAWADIALLLLCSAACFHVSCKKIFRGIIAGTGVILSAALLFFVYCYPYWNSVTYSGGYWTKIHDQTKTPAAYDETVSFADAKSDVDRAMQILCHIHPAFRKDAPDAVSALYEESVSRLEQQDVITVTDVSREISRMIAVLGDAHTNVSYTGETTYLKDFYIRFMDGWTPESVNGIPFDEFYADSLSQFSYESENHAYKNFINQMVRASGLTFLGLDPFNLTITWSRDGETETMSYSEKDYASLSEMQAVQETYTGQSAEETESFVSYQINPENDLAVFRLNECINNSEYQSCVSDFFAEVKATGIRNVAVDLRYNGGGNSGVANEFIRYLPVDSYRTGSHEWRWGPFLFHGDNTLQSNQQQKDLTFDGNLFVLTSFQTFSSATKFAELISDNGLGLVIGETSSNATNAYGDITIFQLDNTGLLFTVSMKKFWRADPSKGDYVVPDIPCAPENALDVLKEYIAR